MTIAGLRALLHEIDRQGGPEAARQWRLHLPDDTQKGPNPMAQPVPQLSSIPELPLRSTPAAEPQPLPVGQLLKWGDEHDDPDVRDQAARARIALYGLRQRHAADQELAAIAEEREQLEKRLAEIQAREAELAPAQKAKGKRKPVEYPAAEVRAWATANNVDCPAVGRVPRKVVDAWREATGSTAAGGTS
ncbi:Lsr2 family DNA-binding protein [Streptomyces kebangsaanensis]|uniref:Lsr2 family DNA-binding protein n=1 Tax=Streptomyces kebangsaanensis TaxID=864058 RepID=UPI00093AFB2E|nr:Lsr2 family protein [Streptomyces kebangsaanensis]